MPRNSWMTNQAAEGFCLILMEKALSRNKRSSNSTILDGVGGLCLHGCSVVEKPRGCSLKFGMSHLAVVGASLDKSHIYSEVLAAMQSVKIKIKNSCFGQQQM